MALEPHLRRRVLDGGSNPITVIEVIYAPSFAPISRRSLPQIWHTRFICGEQRCSGGDETRVAAMMGQPARRPPGCSTQTILRAPDFRTTSGRYRQNPFCRVGWRSEGLLTGRG